MSDSPGNTTATMEIAELDTQRLPLSEVTAHPDPKILSQTIITKHKDGMNGKMIAAFLGVDRHRVYNVLRRAGLTKQTRYTVKQRKQRDKEIVRLHLDGQDSQSIADQFELSRPAVCSVLRKNGITQRHFTPEQERIQRNAGVIADFANGVKTSILGARYGLTQGAIQRIIGKNSNSILSRKEIRNRNIIISYMAGDDTAILCDSYNLSAVRINEILRDQGVFKAKAKEKLHMDILDLLKFGQNRRTIAEELNVTYLSVVYIAQKNGTGWINTERHCNVCGELFTPRTVNNCYCSPDCYVIGKKQKSNAKQMKRCSFCAKPFWVGTAKYVQRFCSLECGQRQRFQHQKLRNEEIWYLRHIQGLTFKRIAEIFTLSISTVHKHYHKRDLQRRIAGAD